MNVVQRGKCAKLKMQTKRNELVRRDTSIGIRGATSLMAKPYNPNTVRFANKAPRYQFSNDVMSTSNKASMGPPLGPPRSIKRKIITNSMSSMPESSSSSRQRPRVLASDSLAANSSHNLSTPRNRPTALRYISSSSRGGHSSARSARSTSTSAVDASVILAISEGRGMARGEMGMAAIDLRHPHLVLCQFSDTLLYTHTLTKINHFNPIEIIVPHTFCEGVKPSQLYQMIKDQFPLVNLTTVQRRHFNDASGRQNIQTLCAPEYSAVYIQVMQKFYALTAAAAVLKYVEYIQCIVFARESLKIEYHSSENTMIIDVGTATQLELVQPLVPSAGQTCCLLGVLGPTYTIGGIRALRAAILQPSCNKEFIEARLDAVQDLIENDFGLMVDVKNVIKKMSDIDKILFLCVESVNQNLNKLGEAQLNQIILLKTTMDMVPKLVEALSSAESGRLRKIKMDFENPSYNEIAERIKQIIQDDAHVEKGAMGSLQRCFAVKPDINGLLDVARRTYSELIDDIQKMVEQLAETYDLPIRLNQNIMKGFHIVLPIAARNRRNFNVEDLPPIFIQVLNTGASVSMTTEELVVLDQQAKESLNEIQKMSNVVIFELLKELRPFMSSLYKLCENVAELDILLALAQTSSIGSYIRPDFNNYLDVRNCVHPLLDYNTQVMPVPNDIYASPENNFTVITGPNMGGKSIYIKQIAIMQIMAQLGCFLPATSAVLRLCDRLFSRIGFNDSVELNASTYVVEMKEIQHILKGLTSSSLVIIDELCRGTSGEEGIGIAWAICEELIMSNAFTFFTTHFKYLTRLQDMYYNVVNRHAVVLEEEDPEMQNSLKRLIYQHKIELGVTQIEHYGLALAARTNIPKDTVNLAIELAEVMEKNTQPQVVNSPEQCGERVLYDLNANIKRESRKSANPDQTKMRLLRKFKEDNPALIERLKIRKSKYINQTECIAKCSSVLNTKYDISNKSINGSPFNVVEQARDDIFRSIDNNTLTNDQINTCYTSNSLLNSIINMHNETNDGNNPQYDSDGEIRTQEKNADAPTGALKRFNRCETTSSDSNNKEPTHEIINHFNHHNASSESDTDELMAKDDIHVDKSSSDSDSNLAEAPTQIVEECFEDANETMSQLERSVENSMSIDDELMMEIVNEINEELGKNSIDDELIILTPPIGFRDFDL